MDTSRDLYIMGRHSPHQLMRIRQFYRYGTEKK